MCRRITFSPLRITVVSIRKSTTGRPAIWESITGRHIRSRGSSCSGLILAYKIITKKTFKYEKDIFSDGCCCRCADRRFMQQELSECITARECINRKQAIQLGRGSATIGGRLSRSDGDGCEEYLVEHGGDELDLGRYYFG